MQARRLGAMRARVGHFKLWWGRGDFFLQLLEGNGAGEEESYLFCDVSGGSKGRGVKGRGGILEPLFQGGDIDEEGVGPDLEVVVLVQEAVKSFLCDQVAMVAGQQGDIDVGDQDHGGKDSEVFLEAC